MVPLDHKVSQNSADTFGLSVLSVQCRFWVMTSPASLPILDSMMMEVFGDLR